MNTLPLTWAVWHSCNTILPCYTRSFQFLFLAPAYIPPRSCLVTHIPLPFVLLPLCAVFLVYPPAFSDFMHTLETFYTALLFLLPFLCLPYCSLSTALSLLHLLALPAWHLPSTPIYFSFLCLHACLNPFLPCHACKHYLHTLPAFMPSLLL